MEMSESEKQVVRALADYARRNEPLIQEMVKSLNSEALRERVEFAKQQQNAMMATLRNFPEPRLPDYVFREFEIANTALTKLFDQRHLELLRVPTGIAEIAQGWKGQFSGISQTVENLRQSLMPAWETHMAMIAQVNTVSQTIAKSLDFQHLLPNLGFAVSELQIIENSFADLTTAYTGSLAYLRDNIEVIPTLPPRLTSYPAVSYYRTTDLIGTFSEEEDQPPVVEMKTGVGKLIHIDTGFLLNRLSDLGVAPHFEEAENVYQSSTKGRTRYFCLSCRELITAILHTLAPDKAIRAWSTDPEHYANNRPKRRTRLLFIFQEYGDSPLLRYYDIDIGETLELIDFLNAKTHARRSECTDDQLESLREKTLNLVYFLLAASTR